VLLIDGCSLEGKSIDVFEFPEEIPLVFLRSKKKAKLSMDLYSPEVTIPAGFITDGATVPRLFQNLVPSFGRYLPAVIIHDYMCVYDISFPVEEARATFKTNLKRCGISNKYLYAMYYSVVWFGPKSWWRKLWHKS